MERNAQKWQTRGKKRKLLDTSGSIEPFVVHGQPVV